MLLAKFAKKQLVTKTVTKIDKIKKQNNSLQRQEVNRDHNDDGDCHGGD